MSEVVQTVCASCGGVNRIPRSRLAAAQGAKCGRCHAPLITGAPEAIDPQRFGAFTGRSDLPVLVDFWAPWCGPCRTLGPILERAAGELAPEIRVAKVNIDEAADLARQLGVQAVPTLALYRRGKELARTSGVMSQSDLVAWVRRAAS
jgi:thioredoxin 2